MSVLVETFIFVGRCCWHKISKSPVGLGVIAYGTLSSERFTLIRSLRSNYRLINDGQIAENIKRAAICFVNNNTNSKQIDEPQWLPLHYKSVFSHRYWILIKCWIIYLSSNSRNFCTSRGMFLFASRQKGKKNIVRSFDSH